MSRPSAEYWAGFFDGEGHVGVQTSPAGNTYIHVTVTQMDRRPLVLLQNRYGGYLAVNKKHGDGRARTWKWGSNGSQVVKAFLIDISPFLLVKATEVSLALRLVDLVGSSAEGSQLLRAQLGAQIKQYRTQKIERIGG